MYMVASLNHSSFLVPLVHLSSSQPIYVLLSASQFRTLGVPLRKDPLGCSASQRSTFGPRLLPRVGIVTVDSNSSLLCALQWLPLPEPLLPRPELAKGALLPWAAHPFLSPQIPDNSPTHQPTPLTHQNHRHPHQEMVVVMVVMIPQKEVAAMKKVMDSQ